MSTNCVGTAALARVVVTVTVEGRKLEHTWTRESRGSWRASDDRSWEEEVGDDLVLADALDELDAALIHVSNALLARADGGGL
jgi:hypothetical protein